VGVSSRDDELLELYGKHESAVERDSPALLYSDVVRETMRRIAAELSTEAGPEWIERLGSSVGDWPAFPDSAESLLRLEPHYELCILSNVDRLSFTGSARKLIVEFDLIVTAQDVGSYKPSLRNFEILLERLRETLGVEPYQILHVVQSLFHDHSPAQELGLKTVWIDRRHGKSGSHGSTPEPAGGARFDAVFPSMRTFAAWAVA